MTSTPGETRPIARARERFLESGDLGNGTVRDPIVTSWRRSRFWEVPDEFRELPYRPDLDTESLLVHVARPVLDRLQTLLADMTVGIVLTDADANVLDRRVGDPSLTRELDAVWLAPGFSYAEKFVGTNGIGTALEAKRPTHVFGSEHFSNRLQMLSCAGAPIENPLTGRTQGVIDVTSWESEASPLMSALVQQAAGEVERRLFDQASRRERALLDEFLVASRRAQRAVVTVGSDLFIANATASRLLNQSDQALVRERAVELMGTERPVTTEVLLSGGQEAKLRFRPVKDDSGTAGAIVELSLRNRNDRTPRPRPARPSSLLPGLAGRSPRWLKACAEVETQCKSRSWLRIIGEPGTGKSAIAEAAHRRWFPTGPLVIINPTDRGDVSWRHNAQQLLGEPNSTIVVRHVDQLRPDILSELAHLLESGIANSWVVATSADSELEVLPDLFPLSVVVPPLRHHVEDISDLVSSFVQRYAPQPPLTFTPAALRAMTRAPWAGNIAQLKGVTRLLIARHRTGNIELDDLPAECRVASHRVLSQWEVIERDAIAQALVETNGDRVAAGRQLGISRATIYRKINAYGILVEPTVQTTRRSR